MELAIAWSVAGVMKNYRLYRVNPWSTFKLGCLAGWLTAFLPVAGLGWLAVKTASALASWLQGLVYRIELPLPGDFGFEINGIELLHLQEIYNRMAEWAGVGGLTLFLLILLTTSVFGLLAGATAALISLVFNGFSRATGGIEVTLSEKDLDRRTSV